MKLARLLAVGGVLSLLAACAPKAEPEAPVVVPTGPAPQVGAAPDGAAPAADPALAGKKIRIISNANSPFWDAVNTGLEAGAKEGGVEAELVRNDGTVPGQIKRLEEALASKDQILGVAISVLQPDAQGILDGMKKLREAGVPVVTVDSDSQPDYREAFVGTNNVAAGKALGEKAKELLPGGAKLCMFVGDPSSQNARDRKSGFEAGAGAKFKVVELYKDDTDVNKARTNVESAMVAHADVTLLVGIWSYNGPAIAAAVSTDKAQAEKITVLAFDAEPNLLPLLEAGKVRAALVQQPYEMGRQSVLLLKALATKDDATKSKMIQDGVVDTGFRVVTPETYAEFKKDLDAKGLKSS
ncbi:MAG: substrate-binding domain-containing protein [Fimbriimonadaceae bacterium]|nr:substrate-binding domain-containing protein [Fimbriimonadaceae bacterium]